MEGFQALERRAQLMMFLEESRLNASLERHLLDALRRVREARLKADGFVTSIIRDTALQDISAIDSRIMLDGIREDVAAAWSRAYPDSQAGESAVPEPDSDWIRCVPECDNTPDMDGFYPCLPDGTKVEPYEGGLWDNGRLLYCCARCGRIIDQQTLEVTGRKGHEPH